MGKFASASREKYILSEASERSNVFFNGTPSTYKIFGRIFETKIFRSIKNTNDFCENNPEWGVLASKKNDTEIHVAKLADRGQIANK